MNVLEERGVKLEITESKGSKKGINLVYFLFWTSLYQLLCVSLFFWADFLPWYGQVDNIKEFGKKYVLLFCCQDENWLACHTTSFKKCELERDFARFSTQICCRK